MKSIIEYRELATKLVTFACGGAAGRSEDDPVYQRVTEGRDVGPMRAKYSSCGDLAHWLYFRLGVRCDFVNRKEHRGWAVGENVSRLVGCPVMRRPSFQDGLACGDVLVIWAKPDGTDAHVIVVLDDERPFLHTAEYGQPGAALKAPRLHLLNGRPAIGQRYVQAHLPLVDVLVLAERQGKLVAPDLELLASITPAAPEGTRPALRLGSGGDAVMELQRLLNATGQHPPLKLDGDFGPKTAAALIAYQRSRALKPDGVCGRYTWYELTRETGS